MRLIYEMIGRTVVAVVRARYGKQLGVAGGTLLAGAALAAYLLASRDVEEG